MATNQDTPNGFSSTECTALYGALSCDNVLASDNCSQVLPNRSTRLSADIHNQYTISPTARFGGTVSNV
jgi:hypothetical protein